MEYAALNNGVKMPMAGIGTFLLTPDEAETSCVSALQNGYRLIDTANAYVNEKAVGRAMKKSGLQREEIFLETKLWPSFYEQPDAVDKTIAAIRETGCKVGLSINPGTDPQVIFPWLDKLDLVLVMGVNPGFGGQSFMPATPERIAAVKAECVRRGLSPRIEVDGGVNAQTAKVCTAAGANVLVAGSAFFKAGDKAAFVRAVK